MGNKSAAPAFSKTLNLSHNNDLVLPKNINTSNLPARLKKKFKKDADERERLKKRTMLIVGDVQFYENINCLATLSWSGTSTREYSLSRFDRPFDVTLWTITKLEDKTYEFSLLCQYLIGSRSTILFLHNTIPAVIGFTKFDYKIQLEFRTIKPYCEALKFPVTGTGYANRNEISQFSSRDSTGMIDGDHWFIRRAQSTLYVYHYQLNIKKGFQNQFIKNYHITLQHGYIEYATAVKDDSRKIPNFMCLTRPYTDTNKRFDVFLVELEIDEQTVSRVIWSISFDQLPVSNGARSISTNGQYVMFVGRSPERQPTDFNSVVIYDIYANRIVLQQDLNAYVAYCRAQSMQDQCPCFLVNSVDNFYFIVMNSKLYKKVLLEFFCGLSEIVDIVLLYLDCTVLEIKNQFDNDFKHDVLDKVVLWNRFLVTNVKKSYAVRFFNFYDE